MKRLLPLLLILALLLAACGGQPDPAAKNEKEALPEASAEPEPEAGEEPEEVPDSLKVFPPEHSDSTPEPFTPGQADREGPDEDELPLLEESPPDGVPTLDSETVTLDGISSYLRVDLPRGWTWEQAGGTEEGTVYGLWPEDDPEFKVELHYWPQSFAMCGTGVSTQEYVLPNGEKATLAYEIIDDSISWTLILPESPDSFTIQFNTAYSLYEAHRLDLEQLLGTIRQGVLAQLDVVNPATSID